MLQLGYETRHILLVMRHYRREIEILTLTTPRKKIEKHRKMFKQKAFLDFIIYSKIWLFQKFYNKIFSIRSQFYIRSSVGDPWVVFKICPCFQNTSSKFTQIFAKGSYLKKKTQKFRIFLFLFGLFCAFKHQRLIWWHYDHTGCDTGLKKNYNSPPMKYE